MRRQSAFVAWRSALLVILILASCESEEPAENTPDPNVIGCACQWGGGPKVSPDVDTGDVSCEGPWTPATSTFLVEQEAAVDDCILKAKAASNGPSYKCGCICDTSYVATGASSNKMLCK